MKKGKFLAGFLAVCTVAALATVNASAFPSNWNLHQYQGAPSSDDVYSQSFDFTTGRTSTTMAITSCSFANDSGYVSMWSSTGIVEVKQRPTTVSVPCDKGVSASALVDLGTDTSGLTFRASGYINS